ncbi:MAG TPA: alcohol dehydrogenase catalytic domain-containing protein [Solirubrobacteraceae bacterium]
MTRSATAHAWFLTGPHSLELRTLELGPLADGWARVRFRFCGLCGSDMLQYEGRPEAGYPVSIGHEFVADVMDTGRGVEHIKRGDVVTSDLNYRCGACDQCRAGRSHLCRRGQVGLFSNRGFADVGDLDAGYLVPIASPARPSLALAEPLSCVQHGRAWANPQPHERVLVVGAGSLGLCLAFALCHGSPGVRFDITDEHPARLADIGDVVEPLGRSIPEPDGEYDVVFDLSGTDDGLRKACDHAKAGARVCSLSHMASDTPAPWLASALVHRDITFTVSYLNGERETLAAAADLLARAWDHRWEARLEVLPLDQLPRAFADRRVSPHCKTVMAVAPPSHAHQDASAA